MFIQPLIFASIPKAYGFEAATHFQLILLRGSLITIVVIGMGMTVHWLSIYKFLHTG